MGDRFQDRTQRFDTDRHIEEMDGEDEEGEVAHHGEEEVKENVEERLQRQKSVREIEEEW